MDLARAAGDEPLLGSALTKLAHCLGATGSDESALGAAREAADIFRRLVVDRPGVYESDAANAYGTLSDLLEQTDQPDEALSVMKDALAIQRWRFDQGGSLSVALDLVGALHMMDDRLLDVGPPADKMAVVEERRRVYRGIAGAGPHARDVQVATMLAKLAVTLQREGQASESREVADAAIEIVDGLEDESPVARAEAARVMTTVAGVRAQAGPNAALYSSDMAVDLYRELAQQYPGSYRKELAAALADQAQWLAAAGQKIKAWKVGREANKLAGVSSQTRGIPCRAITCAT